MHEVQTPAHARTNTRKQARRPKTHHPACTRTKQGTFTQTVLNTQVREHTHAHTCMRAYLTLRRVLGIESGQPHLCLLTVLQRPQANRSQRLWLWPQWNCELHSGVAFSELEAVLHIASLLTGTHFVQTHGLSRERRYMKSDDNGRSLLVPSVL